MKSFNFYKLFFMETTCSKPRRAWLAALLSLFFGPIGQVYAGRLRRSICLRFIGMFLLLVIAFGLIKLPIGKSGFISFDVMQSRVSNF